MTRHSGNTVLLATDRRRSMLASLDGVAPIPAAYAPYGHHPFKNDLFSRVGFNGEQPDPLTGYYHLGNGYRQFNPVLRRFNAPDSWSPLGRGGINAYAYCAGDPVNRTDPSGHIWGIGKFLKKIFLKKPKTPSTAQAPTAVSKSASNTNPGNIEPRGLKAKSGEVAKEPPSPWSFAVRHQQKPESMVLSAPSRMTKGLTPKSHAAETLSLQTAGERSRENMVAGLFDEYHKLLDAPGPSYLVPEKDKKLAQLAADIRKLTGGIR